tara:strand:- start:26701 stop:27618 length:918 start_codon:yes stop_codon:yes gene_type:complete
MKKKLNVAILGTGNIGADLFFKIIKSDHLNCVLFSGRNQKSKSYLKVESFLKKKKNLKREKNVMISKKHIKSVESKHHLFDILFDCTSAKFHNQNRKLFKKLKKKIINLTPSQHGQICVPAINLDESKNFYDLNMITCGAQASVPIAYSFKQIFKKRVSYIEVVSTISSYSAGPATRLNIDEYISSTQKAISYFTGVKKTKAILNLNPAKPQVNMQTSIFVKIGGKSVTKHEFVKINQFIGIMVNKVKKYNQDYKIIVKPHLYNNVIVVTVSTRGQGDYLPRYAGNLDIITSAALAAAENYAKKH